MVYRSLGVTVKTYGKLQLIKSFRISATINLKR